MKHTASLFVLMFLTACASTGQEERVNAIKDFIEINELEKTEEIRTFDQLEQHILNERFVIVNTRQDAFLLEYPYPCRDDPLTQRPRPDIRRDANAIYAGSDTFRGCQIGALYPITEDQVAELKNIGEAPGEK